MDTFGGLIDKLFTVDMKMWNNQEVLYEIRRMTFEQFKEKYYNTEEGAENLFKVLAKVCDLNVQRNQLIDEVDATLIKYIKAAAAGKDLDNGEFLQEKHKTY